MIRDEPDEVVGVDSDAYDPDPLTIVLEVANLVIQPGALSALAAGISATTGVLLWKDVKDGKIIEMRRKLFEIDRALTDGFASLMLLASLLDQFHHLHNPIRIGGAPITGFKNARRLRKAHEDCRSAVKDARDGFSDLSALLPKETSEHITETLARLDKLSTQIICVGGQYGQFLVAASRAMSIVDEFICVIGEHCEFHRSARTFTDDLILSLPSLVNFKASRQNKSTVRDGSG